MELYDRFAETLEDGFRNDFIKPLLIQLGFFAISNKHGRQEFGKDFVFSDLDRFSNLRHMIVQAKHEKTINQGAKVDDLLSQVKQAFYVPYTLPIAPSEERHVSAVYVFNTGKITDNAETQIRHSLPKELASNVYFYDGDHLLTLSKITAQRHDATARETLLALKRELRLNIGIWHSLESGLDPSARKPVYDVRGPLLRSIEDFIARPVMPDRISLDEVGFVWQRAKVIQVMVEKYYSNPYNLESRIAALTTLKLYCAEVSAKAITLAVAIDKALESIPSTVI